MKVLQANVPLSLKYKCLGLRLYLQPSISAGQQSFKVPEHFQWLVSRVHNKRESVLLSYTASKMSPSSREAIL